MEYSEKSLKALNKTQLLEIAAANKIEAAEGAAKDEIIALILSCPAANGGEPKSPADAANGGEPKSPADGESGGEPKFSKEQLLKSQWYSHRRDALSVLLEDGESYSHGEIEKMLDNFMKGKVE